MSQIWIKNVGGEKVMGEENALGREDGIIKEEGRVLVGLEVSFLSSDPN